MLAAVAAVVIVAFVVTVWLLAIASGANPGTDLANSRLDAIRTGLAAGAGAGAAVGLMLAFRRQYHQEIATVLTDLDATERRITELYTKAVEQLGSDKAPVRLGGLYALERLAQDNPTHRQTIVNVICAYLRMPFSPAAPGSKPERADDTGEPDTKTGMSLDGTADTWQQERQVRLTAQSILTEHLRDSRPTAERSIHPPSTRLWPDISLNLSGPTLINFNLVYGVTTGAMFSKATFSGITGFLGTKFGGFTSFEGAIFSGGAVMFGAATFGREARFGGAKFRDAASFDGATFSHLYASFDGATFSDGALFRKATFSGKAEFVETTFGGDARFDEATADGEDGFSFARSRVLSPSTGQVWPEGWCLEPDGNGAYTVVRANDAGRP